MNIEIGPLEFSSAPQMLQERDFGITEYLTSTEGFNAIIKQRYSDFIVNEIDSHGDVVHLTDVSVQSSSNHVLVAFAILSHWGEIQPEASSPPPQQPLGYGG